jgi:hypothetical protein
MTSFEATNYVPTANVTTKASAIFVFSPSGSLCALSKLSASPAGVPDTELTGRPCYIGTCSKTDDITSKVKDPNLLKIGDPRKIYADSLIGYSGRTSSGGDSKNRGGRSISNGSKRCGSSRVGTGSHRQVLRAIGVVFYLPGYLGRHPRHEAADGFYGKRQSAGRTSPVTRFWILDSTLDVGQKRGRDLSFIES